MRILTVRQPYAWAIIHGGKDVENRSRNIAGDYRGPVAIHAGLAKPEKHNQASRLHAKLHGTDTDTALVFGAIIGTVDLVDVHQSDECFGCNDGCCGGCSEWADVESAYHLELENPRPLTTPLPYKGALGLRHLDDDVAQQITEGLTK